MALGSIPACAGEPDALISIISDMEVYPRVCGGTPKRSFFGSGRKVRDDRNSLFSKDDT